MPPSRPSDLCHCRPTTKMKIPSALMASTTEAVVSDKPEEKGAGMPGGGMPGGGMGDMDF